MAGRKEPVPAPSWWAQRWLQYMNEVAGLALTPAQIRGARQGEARLRVERGRVLASVPHGSYGEVAGVMLRVKPLTVRDRRRLLDALAAETGAALRLLSGNIGPELEQVFTAAALALFPEPAVRYPLRCTCRRWRCRHVRVLAVRGAEMFEGNPFLWLEVLGLPRDELFAQLRARLADSGQALADAAGAGLPLDPKRFWQGAADPGTIPVEPGKTAGAAALLRVLGPIPLPPDASWVEVSARDGRSGGTLLPLNQLLGRYVARIGAVAGAVARGDQPPVYRQEELPGKPVAAGIRLAAEVEAAVRQAGAALSLDQLQPLCPTAAAVPAPHHRPLLAEAFPHLPPDLVVLADRTACPRGAVLAGAAFRHVITFAEWRRQALDPDGDWARALRIAGWPPPDLDALLAGLTPEVGDELWLVISEPDPPVLKARLQRRAQRSHTAAADLAAADLAAARALIAHMDETGRLRLTETEAVGALLAAGRYREPVSPDPVWLLPLVAADDLQYDDLDVDQGRRPRISRRRFSWDRWRWQPTFGRPSYGWWPGQERALREFTVDLANRGAGRRAVELALACAGRWCRYWRGPQDQPGQTPGLAALLDFLWNQMPLDARSRYWAPAAVLESLAAWFAYLSERHPGLGPAYADHIASCGLVDAFAHRMQTALHARGGAPAEREAWRLEGYRWIGPEGCLGRPARETEAD